MLKKLLKIFSQNKSHSALILIGTAVWSLTMIKSGLVYSYGMGFWGPNGHDGIWHIALAGGLARGTMQMPIFAGEVIKNYHIGFDLFLAAVHKLSLIPIHILYFQILPPVFAILVGIFCHKFVYLWTKNKTKTFWAVFFLYFGGGLGWFVNLLKGQEIAGESMFWSQQSVSTLINPPYAFSLVLIFAGLFYFHKGLEQKNKNDLILATFIFGVLIQIKVYAGILMLVGLMLAGIWNVWKMKGLAVLKVFVGSLILSILLFTPSAGKVSRVLVFKPFWFLETMMIFPDRLGWEKFGEAMVNYKLGGTWLKAIIAYGLALFIFIIGNFGSRVIGIFWFWRKGKVLRSYQYVEVLMIAVIFTGIILPLFIVQKGTAWNTIQFMYYSLLFIGVLAGVYFGGITMKLKSMMVRIFILLTILLTVPTTPGVLFYHYLPSRPPAMISKKEMEALDFLSNQNGGIVLTQPFDKKKADAAIVFPPRPLYLYESTAYVSAFSEKTTYLEDQMNLEITGYDWQSRRRKVENFFSNGNLSDNSVFLKNNKIEFLYILKDFKEGNLEENQFLSKIYENSEVEIYRVN